MEQCHLSKDSIPLLYERIVCYIRFLLHTIRIIAMFLKLIFGKNEIDHIILLFRNLNMYKICPNVCNSHCASGPGCTVVSLASPEASSLALFFSPCAPVFAVFPSVLLLPVFCSVVYGRLQAPICFSKDCLLSVPQLKLWYHLGTF